MYRKFLNCKPTGILAIALLLFMAVGVAEEERTDAAKQWKYVLEDGGATITGYVEEPAEELVFPSELDGYPVTGIGRWVSDDIYLTSITIPSSVTSISPSAFAWYCVGLANITIPDSVTSIGDSAFYYCDLTSVTIPASMTEIGRNPFEGCPLTAIDVAVDNPVYEQVDGVLLDKQKKTLVAYPHGKNVNPYTIPEGVLHIGDGAFSNHYGLLSVIIPDGVTSIGDMAFWACGNLSSVTIPDSVTSIGNMAFDACEKLTSVAIPDSVVSIGEEAFGWDSKVTFIVNAGSFAEQYAEDNGISYVFSEAALSGGAQAADEEVEIQEITVGTAEELLNALDSNRRILLKEGVYNLTSAAQGFQNNANVYFAECFGGDQQLYLKEVHNLTIQGVGDAQSEIVVEPNTAFSSSPSVMDFYGCSNVRIANIKVGYVEGRHRSGVVLWFESCTDIEVDGTMMYGIGAAGLGLYAVEGAKVTNSTICDFSDAIMRINDSSDILFEGCVFRDNQCGAVIFTTSNLTIDSCAFLRNADRNVDMNSLFNVASLANVRVVNTEFTDNSVRNLVDHSRHDIAFDASNRFENNVFD